jgi:hypothetical protein
LGIFFSYLLRPDHLGEPGGAVEEEGVADAGEAFGAAQVDQFDEGVGAQGCHLDEQPEQALGGGAQHLCEHALAFHQQHQLRTTPPATTHFRKKLKKSQQRKMKKHTRRRASVQHCD